MTNTNSHVFQATVALIAAEEQALRAATDAQERKYHERKLNGLRYAASRLARSRSTLGEVEADLRNAANNFVGPFACALGKVADLAKNELSGGVA